MKYWPVFTAAATLAAAAALYYTRNSPKEPEPEPEPEIESLSSNPASSNSCTPDAQAAKSTLSLLRVIDSAAADEALVARAARGLAVLYQESPEIGQIIVEHGRKCLLYAFSAYGGKAHNAVGILLANLAYQDYDITFFDGREFIGVLLRELKGGDVESARILVNISGHAHELHKLGAYETGIVAKVYKEFENESTEFVMFLKQLITNLVSNHPNNAKKWAEFSVSSFS